MLCSKWYCKTGKNVIRCKRKIMADKQQPAKIYIRGKKGVNYGHPVTEPDENISESG